MPNTEQGRPFRGASRAGGAGELTSSSRIGGAPVRVASMNVRISVVSPNDSADSTVPRVAPRYDGAAHSSPGPPATPPAGLQPLPDPSDTTAADSAPPPHPRVLPDSCAPDTPAPGLAPMLPDPQP